MRFVHAAHDEQAAEGISQDRLHVRRGRTQFPVRPLSSERFLIGSGSNCHLQLGGGLPILHSMLCREAGTWVLEAIAPEPTVFVNGEVCRRRILCVNDVVRLGEFEFVLCGKGGDDRPDLTDQRSNGRGSQLLTIHEDAACLSASDLVDRIEEEFRLIDRLGQSRRAGGTALLRAIQRQGRAQRPRAA